MLHKGFRHIERFLRDQSGPSATEYAVMLGLIVLTALAAITALGAKVSEVFVAVADIG